MTVTAHGEHRGGPRGGVTVTGTGAVQARPDVVVVVLGAEARAARVQDAIQTATVGLGAVREVLVAAGVSDGDLQTSTTSAWPEHAPDGRTTTAFVARMTLRAQVREDVVGDLARAGELVQRALEAAGDVARLDSTSFALSDPLPVAMRAREAAFDDARSKAEQYAMHAGRQLGAVVSVTEGGDGGPTPLRAMAAAAVPLDAGEQSVSVAVTVRWHWAD